MSPSSIGVNLRVTGHCNQGGRKYMEDVFSVAYQQTEDEKDLEYAFFGIFDGHGGKEAALFAKEHLMDSITRQKGFWSEDDDQVLKAIREGFLQTQQAMWKDQVNWQPTNSGLPSTAGTTASVCFIKRGKIFIGHCGDSGIILGERDPADPTQWRARPLTIDHKPESDAELARINEAGGKVMVKSGVPRVVWQRPRGGHQGPVRRSTQIDEVPFLAVARALGDLWSYNAKEDVFVVSPDPDLHVHSIDVLKDRCLILATDGAWNVLSPEMAVGSVQDTERNNERHMIDPEGEGNAWINPSKKLVDRAIDRWKCCGLRADNTSIVTVMLDPPGPPRAQVLRRLHGFCAAPPPALPSKRPPALPPKPASSSFASSAGNKGIAIISRFPNSTDREEKHGLNLVKEKDELPARAGAAAPVVNRIVHDSIKPVQRLKVTSSKTEAIINNLENLVKGRSPPPPPLPVRPAGLASKKALMAAAVATGQKSGLPAAPPGSPATRTRNNSGRREGAAGHEAARFLQDQQQRTPPPRARPVKQPRRSTAPDLGNLSGGSSDEENEPNGMAAASFKTLRSGRRSVAAELGRRAADSARPKKAAAAATTSLKGRRSEPAALPASAPVAESPSARVLRPRNHNGATPEPPSSRLAAAPALSTSASALSATAKRKRRSSSQADPSRGSSAALVGKRSHRSADSSSNPPPGLDAAVRACVLKNSSLSVPGLQQPGRQASSKKARLLRGK